MAGCQRDRIEWTCTCIYTQVNGRADGQKGGIYIYIGCESSLLLLNYCKEGIKYEEQKNLAMDVHYKEPIPDAKSHMFAHPFFFTDPCAPGLHKTYTSKVFFARWICMRSWRHVSLPKKLRIIKGNMDIFYRCNIYWSIFFIVKSIDKHRR